MAIVFHRGTGELYFCPKPGTHARYSPKASYF